MPADKALAVFCQVMDMAAERLYGQPIDFAPDLDRDAAATLFTLSSTPETYGAISPSLQGEGRRLALEHLLTATHAYVRAARKLQVTIEEPTLGLPEETPE